LRASSPVLLLKMAEHHDASRHSVHVKTEAVYFRRDSFRSPNNGAERFDSSYDSEGALEIQRKKFSGRARLFIGNLPQDTTEEELRELFSKFGELSECFISRKGFAFVRMANRPSAEKAKEKLDGHVFKGRPLRVRFAANAAALRVKELSPLVSNELLFSAFSMFGDVERAVHIVDDRGRPTGEGIVEFERKPGAQEALKRVNSGVFLLTGNSRPIVVEPFEVKDDEDGLAERLMTKNASFQRERTAPPRFAPPGTFEFEYGNRWKALYEVEQLKRDELERQLKEARMQLENEMEMMREDYRAMVLREDLRRRQDELERLEAARRERIDLFRLRGGNHQIPAGANFVPPPFIHQMPAPPDGAAAFFGNPDNGIVPQRNQGRVYDVHKLLGFFENTAGMGIPALQQAQHLFGNNQIEDVARRQGHKRSPNTSDVYGNIGDRMSANKRRNTRRH
ncbi:Non-POU domain-containing octamer-binding protein, partial [Trichinella papuae]